jgi:predicted dehydrogenase
MGLVGAGFVGPHHVDAVRRVAGAEVIGVAGSTAASAKAKADALGIERSYGRYEDLINDPDIQVVHNTTPNHLHFAVNAAAIAAGKHIISDKPLGMNAAEAKHLLDLATAAGVFHGVTFNYRGNPLVQHARQAIADGQIGEPRFIHGHYLQDWLLKDEDYSWRLEPDKGGPTSALGDIGSHWCDIAEHVTGRRITHVLADITTAVPVRRGRPMQLEDLASALLRFDNGAKGSFSVGQICAGHKNDLVLEVNGAAKSMRWRQEAQNELWIGERDVPSQILQKDPSLLNAAGRALAILPGGHQEGWSDAFAGLIRTMYGHIAEWRGPSTPLSPMVATFADGYRANCLVDAVLASARAGGVWTEVAR